MAAFLGAWHFDLFVAVNVVLAAVLYLMAIRRVNAGAGTRTAAVMHGRWPAWTTACFLTGLALIGAMYLGPMAAWSHTFFWVHMTQHLVITMAAAPLLVLGAPITLALRACNRRNRRSMIRVLRSRAVRVATDPILTWLLFAGTLLAVHFTPFYDWALANHGAMAIIEQPAFLLVSLLYYLPLIGSNVLPRRPSHAQRLVSLGLMMIPEAVIGAVIYFSPVVLYDGYDTVRPFGLDALADQQLSGAMMWALVMVVDSFWMMWVAADWFASEERRSRQQDAEWAAESIR
ncbi:MAG: cytochrome c oxidase assembly protein [Actinomycetales bacterium]|nr:cytochrome c oxidase assembly protein [Actinomycetales bacterium]